MASRRQFRKKGKHWKPEIDGAVRECVDLMLDNKWVTGRSHLEIAEKYQRTAKQMLTITATASRFIRLCRGKEDVIRDRILLSIDHAERAAFDAEKQVYDTQNGVWVSTKQPDLRALHSFLQMQIEVHGLCRSAKDEADGESTVKLPIDELTELLSELGYEVRKKDGASTDDSDDDGEPTE